MNTLLRKKSMVLTLVLGLSFAATPLLRGQGSASAPATVVPPIIKFTGVMTTPGSPNRTNVPAGLVTAAFSLYEFPEGGNPLWAETQKVQVDEQGHYVVLLGATSPTGLPVDLFTSGKALWLGVQPQLSGMGELPRVLLVAVPYALKAADADTLGGLPASAFLTASTSQLALASGFASSGSASPLATITGSGITNYIPLWTSSSNLGNSALYQNGGKVGIGTITPEATLDVRGFLNVPSTTSATVGTIDFGGKPFIHECCNDTAPGTGYTDTFVGLSAGNFSTTAYGNTGVGSYALQHITSGYANSAFGAQGLEANTTGDTNTALGFDALFSNVTGNYNTAIGGFALPSNTVGTNNTAVGYLALWANDPLEPASGSNNTAVGSSAGYNGSTTTPIPANGSNGTFIGANATATVNGLTNATAIGYNARVAESNALVLGGTGADAVNVGIGTATPSEPLTVIGNASITGNLHISGTLSKGSGSFKIDHPLDPGNKYLYHSFVESPDMMDVYNGEVVLDAHGCAWVTLPDYFEALNRDFRYQLTAVGAPGPNLYIAAKVSGNRFKIAGGKPHSEVSWQVTGVRQDAFANAHRIPVEENKAEAERGRYIYPELYGQPLEKAIGAPAEPTPTKELARTENAHTGAE